MLRPPLLLITAAALLLGAPRARAEHLDLDRSDLYETSVLQKRQAEYAPLVARIYKKEIKPFLKRPRDVKFSLPLTDPDGELLNSWADVKTGTVVMPVLTLAFLHDLLAADVWLEEHHRKATDLLTYLLLLKYRQPDVFPGGRYPTPFKALGIPWEDSAEPRFDAPEDARKFELMFHGVLLFITAHESAHILYAHGHGAFHDEVSADEMAAGLIAMRDQAAATGMMKFFEYASYWVPNASDDPEDYRNYLHSDHPINGDRVLALAGTLEDARARFFADVPASDPRPELVAAMGAILESVGRRLNDATASTANKTVAENIDPTEIDGSDIIELSQNWWGVSFEDFPRVAGLKPGQYTAGVDPTDASEKIIMPAAGVHWSPKELFPLELKFPGGKGLTSIEGFLPKGETQKDVLRTLILRYGNPQGGQSYIGMSSYYWTVGQSAVGISPFDFTISPSSAPAPAKP